MNIYKRYLGYFEKWLKRIKIICKIFNIKEEVINLLLIIISYLKKLNYFIVKIIVFKNDIFMEKESIFIIMYMYFNIW